MDADREHEHELVPSAWVTLAPMGVLADVELPDGLRTRLGDAGWTVEYLKETALPWWTQWDGAVARGEAFAFVRVMVPGDDPIEGAFDDVVPESWARHDDDPRVLLVGAHDPERADELLGELLEALDADGATKRSVGRWLHDLGLSSVEVETAERDGDRELVASANLGPLDVTVRVERPTASKGPSEAWTRFRDSGVAFATAGSWRVSVAVTSPAKGQALIDELRGC